MKFVLVLLICCGIVVGHFVERECNWAIRTTNKADKFKTTHMAAWMLWNLNMSGKMLTAYPEKLKNNPTLDGIVTEIDSKQQWPQVHDQLLDLLKKHEISDSPMTLNEKRASDFKEMVRLINVESRHFFGFVKTALQSTDEVHELGGSGESMYLSVHMIMALFFSQVPDYNSEANISFNKFYSNRVAVGETLEKSAFGRGLNRLFNIYKIILDEIKFLFDYSPSTNEGNNDENNNWDSYNRYITHKLNDLYGLKNVCDVLMYLVQCLSSATDVEALALPNTNAIELLCSALEVHVVQLKELLRDIKKQFEEKNASFLKLIEWLLKKVYPMGLYRVNLDKQLVVILESLPSPNHLSWRAFNLIDPKIAQRGTKKGTVYDPRHTYLQMCDRANEKLLGNWNYINLLARQMWLDLLTNLLTISKKQNYSSDEVYRTFIEIVEKFSVGHNTLYLSDVHAVSEKNLSIGRGTVYGIALMNFMFMQLYRSLGDEEKHSLPEEKKKELDDKAAEAFGSMQRMLYKMKTVYHSKRNNFEALEAAIKQNDRLLSELDESSSNSDVRASIEPLVLAFLYISVDFKTLIDLHKAHSTQSNTVTIQSFLATVAEQLIGTCDFIISSQAFSHIMNELNNKNDSIKMSPAMKNIPSTIESLQRHGDDRKAIINQLDEVFATNRLEDSQFKTITQLIWKLNGTRLVLRKQLLEILHGFPAIPENYEDLKALLSDHSTEVWVDSVENNSNKRKRADTEPTAERNNE